MFPLFRCRNNTRSNTPVYDLKKFEATPVLVQALPKQRSHDHVLSEFDKIRGGKGIDWKIANNLTKDEMLRYIQHCSIDYTKELDKTFPDLRRVIGYLVKTDATRMLKDVTRERCDPQGCNRLLPCDIYNQSDKCPYGLLHLDSKQDQSIHSCSLCYFSLGGLINLHRQTRCPLLNILKK